MTSREPPNGPGSTIKITEGDDLRTQVAKSLKADLCPLLVVIDGPDVGKTIRLDGTITLGRGIGADEVLTDDRVSTVHVRVEDRGDTWAVVDLGSTNGTRVDDALVAEAIVSHHTKIEI